MKKNKSIVSNMKLMECPRCKENKIQAHSIRDCYYDYLYCPKCGQMQISVRQDREEKHSGFSTDTYRILQTTTYSYADGKEIKLSEVLYAKNS